MSRAHPATATRDLREQTGCRINLDLQRAAVSTGASSLQSRLKFPSFDQGEQLQWLIEGHKYERIVCESLHDIPAFDVDVPVVHLADLPEATS